MRAEHVTDIADGLEELIECQRWSPFFDHFAALLRWIRVSFQAANLNSSVLLA